MMADGRVWLVSGLCACGRRCWAGYVGGLRALLSLWPCWAGRVTVGPCGQEKGMVRELGQLREAGRAGCYAPSGPKARAGPGGGLGRSRILGWLVMCLGQIGFPISSSISFFSISISYYLNKPRLLYCIHVSPTCTPPSGVHLRSTRGSGVHVKGWQFTGIELIKIVG